MLLVLLPVLTAAAFAAAALRACATAPLGPYGEACPHLDGHLVLSAVALLVTASVWHLAGREVRPAARRAALTLASGWALVAFAGAVEALGAVVGDGSGENGVHTLGTLLIGPGVALAVLGHAAVTLAPGSRLPQAVRLGLGLTVAGWFGLGTAGSGVFLLLGLTTAATWLLTAATAYRQHVTGASDGDCAPSQPAVAAELLWIPHGALELLQPWGPDTRYDAAFGHDVVIDVALFTAYSLPGSLALVLSGLALVVLTRRLATGARAGRIAGRLAVALGASGAAGVLVRFDPVFTSARLFGTLLLGVGVLATARHVAAHRRPLLLLLGMVGVAAAAGVRGRVAAGSCGGRGVRRTRRRLDRPGCRAGRRRRCDGGGRLPAVGLLPSPA